MDRTGYPTKQSSPGTREISFLFQTNGASAPDTTKFDGAKSFISSVTHTGGSNDYIIKLADPAVKVLHASAEVLSADGHWLSPSTITSEASATPPTVTFLVWAAGGTAANDYTANKVVMVRLLIKNTTVSG